MNSLNSYRSKSLVNPTKVRKKAERKQINAHKCYECYNYYKTLNLSEEEIEKRMQSCSRHRSNIPPSKEPDNFWDLDFPTEEEMEKRKMMIDTTKKKPDVDDDFDDFFV